MTQVDGKYLAVDMYVQGSSTPIAMTFEPNDNASLSGWVAYLPNPNSDAKHIRLHSNSLTTAKITA